MPDPDFWAKVADDRDRANEELRLCEIFAKDPRQQRAERIDRDLVNFPARSDFTAPCFGHHECGRDITGSATPVNRWLTELKTKNPKAYEALRGDDIARLRELLNG